MKTLTYDFGCNEGVLIAFESECEDGVYKESESREKVNSIVATFEVLLKLWFDVVSCHLQGMVN